MTACGGGGWPRALGCIALGIFFAFGWASGAATAQAPAADSTYYTRQSTFLIPFQTDPGDRRIQSVWLHVSDDFGKTYRNVAMAGPNERSFRFQAPKDGWYWFATQTIDVDHRQSPPNVNLAPPGLKVCVDTQPPRVNLRPRTMRDYPASVEWDVYDDNLDLSTMRVDYRVAGSADWRPLPIQQLALGSHDWNPGASAQLEVRLQVRDKAANEGTATITLVPGGGRAAVPAGQAQPADAGRLGNVMMVNKRHIKLNFTIEGTGPSGVSGVEIWYTGDQGRSWRMWKRETNPEPPYSYYVDVDGEGRYGFTLLARSGVGLSEPEPRPGDQPQIWVEVDETKPDVRLLSVEVGRGADSGRLTIRWTASDRYLAAAPVTLSYAAAADGPWTPFAQNLPNDGQYVWTMPERVPFQFYIRVEAVDRARNVGHVDSSQPVKVDLALPKARVVGAEAAPATPSAETSPPPGPPNSPPRPVEPPSAPSPVNRGISDQPRPQNPPGSPGIIPAPSPPH